jgi:serpin B
MARAGARGQTADEMDTVLRAIGSDELADAVNALDAALASRSGTFKDAGGEDHQVALRIANSLFSQHDMALQTAYLDAMASRFGAGVWKVDFAADPEAARIAINAWVADQTEQRIPEILKAGQVTQAMRLALVNAIYLKAPWFNPFDKDQTAKGPFTLADGSTAQVPLMHLLASVPYGSGPGWKAVELPYVGDGLAMTIILPDDMAAFQGSLDAAALARIVGSLEPTKVNLTLPAFDTESRAELSELLKAMGMPAAFDGGTADFSGITAEERLYIGFVIHQANITVDEAGTEAAAATVVGFDTAGPGAEPTNLRIDRPFLFVLRDVPTGAIVFMGRVSDPGTRS